jgi:hypothetical protein
MKWSGHVALKGEMRNAYKILVGKPERKRPLRRSRLRWEDNIRIDLREIMRFTVVEWIHLAQVRDMWRACEHGSDPSGSITGEEFLD